MNEMVFKEKITCDARQRRDEIQRLYIDGYPTGEISERLGLDGRRAGRNLREIKRRWNLAAARSVFATTTGRTTWASRPHRSHNSHGLPNAHQRG
jgi:hypothetical protein